MAASRRRLLQTQGDTTVPVENSPRHSQALTSAGVPAELYVFEPGGHGIGMRDGSGMRRLAEAGGGVVEAAWVAE